MAVGLSYLHIMLAFLFQHKPLVSVILFCEYGLIAVRIAGTADISVCGAVIVYNLLFLPFVHGLCPPVVVHLWLDVKVLIDRID